ncbi:hypothetical protein B0H21DRAFT_726892 [Amylocystis lapponica]|nr:hypothetical protein B0H21DRAFT_726892 [Amylocystis lapponica]
MNIDRDRSHRVGFAFDATWRRHRHHSPILVPEWRRPRTWMAHMSGLIPPHDDVTRRRRPYIPRSSQQNPPTLSSLPPLTNQRSLNPLHTMDDSWPQSSGNAGNQGPGAGANAQDLQQQGQGAGGGYDQMQGNQQGAQSGYGQAQGGQQESMGGGVGSMGSGVAGGYSGQQQQSGQPQAQGQTQDQAQEKQDWLDKGIEFLGKKAGVNVSNQNADKAGDYMNKEFQQREGRGLPGVQ